MLSGGVNLNKEYASLDDQGQGNARALRQKWVDGWGTTIIEEKLGVGVWPSSEESMPISCPMSISIELIPTGNIQ